MSRSRTIRELHAWLDGVTVASSRQVLDRFGASALRTAMKQGTVVRLLEGYYALADAAAQTRTRALATSRWLGSRGVVSGISGAITIEAVRQGLTSSAKIRRRMQDYPRIRGRQLLKDLLAELDGGIESYLELRALQTVFLGAALAQVRRQVTLTGLKGTHRVDFFLPRARLCIETDGARFHGDDAARRRDLARDADLAAAGYQTLRFTFEDVMHRPAWCRCVIEAAASARQANAA